MNEVTKDDIVHLIALGGQQLLWYKVRCAWYCAHAHILSTARAHSDILGKASMHVLLQGILRASLRGRSMLPACCQHAACRPRNQARS